jgi:DNA repair photolyase
MLAPVIPGLNESEIPTVLKSAKQAGAASAAYLLLRLPLTVQPVFLDWLERHYPLKRQRVESLIRGTRDGRLNDPRFRSRMRGNGPVADHIAKTFKLFSKKLGLDRPLPELDCSDFRSPEPTPGQRRLF